MSESKLNVFWTVDLGFKESQWTLFRYFTDAYEKRIAT